MNGASSITMRINLDLHIHSKYSAATSKRMDLSSISKEAKKKGIDIMGSGDCLHPRWLEEVCALPKVGDLYELNGTYFLLTVEVEDKDRVHHLILIPDRSKAIELKEALAPKSNNINSDGRPTVRMSGAQIAEQAIEAGCMIGPSHAFTPWTGVFAHHKSLEACYGDITHKIKFIELGLSADTNYADRISELRSRTYLSFSDAHSPNANKLGREFVQVDVAEKSFEEVKKAISNEGRITLNVGFYPEEGKYNRTACTRCYKQYSRKDMEDMMGRCSCKGIIKLGVKDRVDLLADSPEPIHPSYRPPYLHLIPLTEIITKAIGHKSIYTAGVQKIWNQMVIDKSEIEILVETDLNAIDIDERVKKAVLAFRSGDVRVEPGGGGKYGDICLPDSCDGGKRQRSLFDF